MDHILAAFRARRGPFGKAGAGGKGDDDCDDDDLDADDDVRDDDRHADEEDPAIEKSLATFERLFDLLLKPDAEARQLILALDLAQYVCERLQPAVAQANRWLEKLVPALLKAGVPKERREDVAVAILTLPGTSPTPSRLRWVRTSPAASQYRYTPTRARARAKVSSFVEQPFFLTITEYAPNDFVARVESAAARWRGAIARSTRVVQLSSEKA